jgi:RimJ/RimL family protein N-acetyltransferase
VVVAEHRGRGLAGAIKAESVRFTMREMPGLTAMITANDTGNAPMLAVNRRLGFEPVSTWTTVTVAV